MNGKLNVRELKSGEESCWDNYVRSSRFSTPQHLSGWKQVMEQVFNSQTHYLLAEENDCITGVLPLIRIKSPVVGHYVTSFPGGLCAENDEAAGALLEYAKEFLMAANARYLILRDGRKKWELPGLITDEEHVTFLIKITSDLDRIKHTLKNKTRQYVNQTSNNGLATVLGLANLGEYYPVYSRAMHEIGNPTLGVNFFQSLAARFPGRLDLIMLSHENKVVGGGFVAPLKQTVYCLWSGLLREYYKVRISYSLAWEAIKYAHRNGYQWVDLGRCRKSSGGFMFKKGFGGQAQQLYQQFYLNGIEKPPIVGATLEKELKYRLFVTIWRKLPQPLTEWLGPELRKQMPFG